MRISIEKVIFAALAIVAAVSVAACSATDSNAASGDATDSNAASGDATDSNAATDGSTDSNAAGGTTDSGDVDGDATGASAADSASCKADLLSDPDNCGSCGHGCLGGSCVSGRCSPVTIVKGLGRPTGIAVDAAFVYYCNRSQTVAVDGIYRIPKPGGSATAIVKHSDNPAMGLPEAIALDDTSIYAAFDGTGSGSAIVRAPKAGGSFTMLAKQPPASYPRAIALAGASRVVWSENGNSAVATSSITGGPVSILASGQTGIFGLVADASNAYWARGSALWRVPHSGGGPTSFYAPTPLGPLALTSDATHLYFSNGTYVMRIAKTGGSAETLAPVSPPTMANPPGIAVDATHVYWAMNSHKGAIYKAPKSGGAPVVLATNQYFPYAVAVDDVAVYWTNGSSNSTSLPWNGSGSVARVAK